MKQSTTDKFAGAFFILCALLGIFLVGLFAWGFIELIQWTTSQ